MDTGTYISYAENDYRYFMDSCNAGFVANSMAVIAQNACEKYLKHIINEYVDADDKMSVMKTHSLNKLLQYLDNYTEISDEQFSNIRQADGYYFSARYPGYDSIEVNKRDVESCRKALRECRQFTLTKIKEFENNKIESVNHNSIEEQIRLAMSDIAKEDIHSNTINEKLREDNII